MHSCSGWFFGETPHRTDVALVALRASWPGFDTGEPHSAADTDDGSTGYCICPGFEAALVMSTPYDEDDVEGHSDGDQSPSAGTCMHVPTLDGELVGPPLTDSVEGTIMPRRALLPMTVHRTPRHGVPVTEAETGSYHDAHDSHRRAGLRVGHDRSVLHRVRSQRGSRTAAAARGADVARDRRGRRLAAQRLPPLTFGSVAGRL